MFVSPAVENMLLGMEKEVWEIVDTSRDIVRTQGEWELLGINRATPKMSVGSSLFDQIMFYVSPETVRCVCPPYLPHQTFLSHRASHFLSCDQKTAGCHNP